MLSLDGSFFDDSNRAAKAGAGITQQVGESCWHNQIGHALPSYHDQSAVVAEIIALSVAIAHAPLGLAVCFATDCAAALYGFRNLVGTVRHTSMRTGIRRQISEAKAG